MFGEQQALAQDWQQLQQLVGYQGPLDAFVQLAQQAGRSSVVAAVQRHTALPWHLGQQQQQQREVDSEQQLQMNSREQAAGPGAQAPEGAGDAGARIASKLPDSQAGSRTALPSFAPAAAAGGGGAAVNRHASDQIAVVARPKQKQAEGVKRKAPAGGSLLKRRR
jgi:hypothetical protein